MVDASLDVPPPRGGPAFLRLNAWPYRVEMGLATAVLAALLFYWRLLVVGDLDLLWTFFWFLWPDLGAFIPIGAASRAGRAWPSWGAVLYDVLHSFLAWAAVFAGFWLWSGTILWPLLGWAAHITLDRSVGYYLRAPARA